MSEDHTNLIFQKQANIGTFFWATVYAACPTCNCTYEPHYDPISASSSYPLQCHNCLLGTHGPYICDAPLLEEPSSNQLHPLKPFLVTSFHKHLVKLLSNKDIEDVIDLACSAALSSLDEDGDERPTNNPFDAKFLRTWKPQPWSTLHWSCWQSKTSLHHKCQLLQPQWCSRSFKLRLYLISSLKPSSKPLLSTRKSFSCNYPWSMWAKG